MTTPGWYPDPLDQSKQRWWDGNAWGASQPIDVPAERTGHRAAARGRSRKPWVIAAVIVVVGAGVGIGLAVTGGSSGPGSFTLHGTMQLTGSVAGVAGGVSTDEAQIVAINGCEGYNGFDDITPGAQVTVTDESGKTIAVGELGTGKLLDGTCSLAIVVDDVPAGRKFYKVEVTHRGGVEFTEKQMRAGDVAVSLDGS